MFDIPGHVFLISFNVVLNASTFPSVSKAYVPYVFFPLSRTDELLA
jgi:hypothetical protein